MLDKNKERGATEAEDIPTLAQAVSGGSHAGGKKATRTQEVWVHG